MGRRSNAVSETRQGPETTYTELHAAARWAASHRPCTLTGEGLMPWCPCIGEKTWAVTLCSTCVMSSGDQRGSGYMATWPPPRS